MEDGPAYEWTEADYKRASAPRMEDFMRFNALRAFDRQKEPHDISRQEYALRINERIRYVDDDVPDTTRTRNKKGDGRKHQQNLQEEEEESKKERFDLNGEVMREELQRRITWAYWLSEWNKKIKMNGKKKDDENDPDGEAMREELKRRINWVYEISKKHGIATSDAASEYLSQAVREATALYSS